MHIIHSIFHPINYLQFAYDFDLRRGTKYAVDNASQNFTHLKEFYLLESIVIGEKSFYQHLGDILIYVPIKFRYISNLCI